jgi:hypothetical protein
VRIGSGLGSSGSDLTGEAGARPTAWLDRSGRLAGSDGPVAGPQLRCSWEKERVGRAGPIQGLTGFRPNRLRENSKTLLFLNLTINYKLI